MKYRIKVTKGKYCPQYKSLLFWNDFEYYIRNIYDIHDSGRRIVILDTEQEARDYIDSHGSGIIEIDN